MTLRKLYGFTDLLQGVLPTYPAKKMPTSKHRSKNNAFSKVLLDLGGQAFKQGLAAWCFICSTPSQERCLGAGALCVTLVGLLMHTSIRSHIHSVRHTHTDRQTDRQTHGQQAGRQTGRQTDNHMHTCIHA